MRKAASGGSDGNEAGEKAQVILGIDPGTLFLGYGVISADKNKVTLIEMGALQLHRHDDHAERLKLIFTKIQSLIVHHQPTAVAIEAPFFGKNVQSMLKLGRAQGVAIAAAMMNGLNAAEYAPRKVKQAVTGKGAADKEQVWDMLRQLMHLPEVPKSWDASDAVAVALCHYYELRKELLIGKPSGIVLPKTSGKKTASNWAAFAEMNPERVK